MLAAYGSGYPLGVVSVGTNAGTKRDRQVRRVLLVEGVTNFTIVLAKASIGLTTGSLALLADALHSLTDVANNLVALAVMRLASMPPDREHPYGHRKFETLAVFSLASLLTLLAFELVLHVFRSQQRQIEQSSWGLIVMLVTIGINAALSLWEHRWARRLDSPILHADASHTAGDVATTVAAVLGWQLSTYGYAWLDAACALIVAALVLWLAYRLFQRAVPVLVDSIALDPEALEKVVQSVDGVRCVPRIRSRWQGTEPVVDATIEVDAALTTADAHRIADAVEEALRERYGVRDVQVHIEPATPAQSVS